MINTVIMWAYVIAVHVLAVTTTAFPIRYRHREWDSTDGGRVTMLTSAGLAAYVDASVIGFWWQKIHPGGLAVWWAVLTVLVCVLTVGSIALHALLIRHHNQERADDGT